MVGTSQGSVNGQAKDGNNQILTALLRLQTNQDEAHARLRTIEGRIVAVEARLPPKLPRPTLYATQTPKMKPIQSPKPQFPNVQTFSSFFQILHKYVDLSTGTMLMEGPVAVRMAKRAINEGLEMDMASALKLEEDCYEQVLHTKDRLEGLNAFAQKRKPIYSGE